MSAPYRSLMPASTPAMHPTVPVAPTPVPEPDYPAPNLQDPEPSITCNVQGGSASATLGGESATAQVNPDGSYMTTVVDSNGGVAQTHSELGGMPHHDNTANIGDALLGECGIDHYAPIVSPQQAMHAPATRPQHAARLRMPSPGG